MIDNVEKTQQDDYPGLTVSRDGDAIVVRIPVRFHRRNGRQMVLTHGDNGQVSADRETNSSLVSAIAKAYRWQEQLESGEHAGLEDCEYSSFIYLIGPNLSIIPRTLCMTNAASSWGHLVCSRGGP